MLYWDGISGLTNNECVVYLMEHLKKWDWVEMSAVCEDAMGLWPLSDLETRARAVRADALLVVLR